MVPTPFLIRAAIVEELNYFNNNQISQLEDLSKVKANTEAVHVRTCWVLCNNGDASNPDMRARLVACEDNKTGKEDACYASTPPGESKRRYVAFMQVAATKCWMMGLKFL